LILRIIIIIEFRLVSTWVLAKWSYLFFLWWVFGSWTSGIFGLASCRFLVILVEHVLERRSASVLALALVFFSNFLLFGFGGGIIVKWWLSFNWHILLWSDKLDFFNITFLINNHSTMGRLSVSMIWIPIVFLVYFVHHGELFM